MEEISTKMGKLAVSALEDKKAEDIKVLDISEISIMADLFIIAGGNNKSHVQSLCDAVQELLGKEGFYETHVEGYDTANWILLDFGSIIVHIFDKENRTLYNLERIWRDGKEIDYTTL